MRDEATGALPDLPPSLSVVEVGLRDGLQAVPEPILSTDQKLRIVERFIEAGVTAIEAVSFAHPKVLPQLADAEALMQRVPRVQGVTYRGLVPNLVGAQRAIVCGLDEIAAVVPADDGLAQQNQHRSVSELIEELGSIGNLCSKAGVGLVVGVASAFLAPARGAVSHAAMMRVVDAAAASGASGVYVATTTGMEHPYELAAGIATVRARHPGLRVGAHLHTRNGAGIANLIAALQCGVDWVESACAGLGGDLWFPGAPEVLGNLATEDVVHICDALGVETGIDLHVYREVMHEFAEITATGPYSFVSRGGTRAELAAASWPTRRPGAV